MTFFQVWIVGALWTAILIAAVEAGKGSMRGHPFSTRWVTVVAMCALWPILLGIYLRVWILDWQDSVRDRKRA